MSQSQNTFDFEISGLPNLEGCDLKITSVVNDDSMKISLNNGRFIISYKLIPKNTEQEKPSPEGSITTAKDDNKDNEGTVENSQMKITIKNQVNLTAISQSLLPAIVSNHFSWEKLVMDKSWNDLILHASESSSGADDADSIDVKKMGFDASDGSSTGYIYNTSNPRRRFSSHGKHEMTLINRERTSYKCTGCKELGFGERYICKNEGCAYILHPDCRSYEEDATHEFLNGSTFKFHEKKFNVRFRYCDACGCKVKGYFYHCQETRKTLHPCCLNLQRTVQIGERKFQLHESLTKQCFYCKSKKDKCWCYSSESQDSQAHVWCLKNEQIRFFTGEGADDKIFGFLKWVKMLLDEIIQFLKWTEKNSEEIKEFLKSAITLVLMIIKFLQMIMKPLIILAPFFGAAEIPLKQIPPLLEAAIKALEALLSAFPK